MSEDEERRLNAAIDALLAHEVQRSISRHAQGENHV